MGTLKIVPVTFKQACEFITEYHRHHIAPQGWKFGAGASVDGKLVGVVMVGRPVARGSDDGQTLEVIRLCTDGTPHACSLLYAAAWRAAKALGYTKIITYILASETGASLRGAGWTEVAKVRGRSWTCPSRPREDKHPTVDKVRWEKQVGD